ncbi:MULTISPECIES: hypothetical protein [unclassified Sinorhizobium]|uniref:hypothetical protein n=1 Tax=unclassified Sinorhizobium TaxID=2613772 RepID=UPI0024C3F1C0|nr:MULTISPECIES: hypothetical protein [unclassified Sinorhizobium]MDK1375093.1 hypothetical protein [Sinorhizobium sp. 6-70]MDK1482966.1 hypothetical protein [Sinorhizobium sp. 6-117]
MKAENAPLYPAPIDRDGKLFASDRTIVAKFFMTMFHEVMKPCNARRRPQIAIRKSPARALSRNWS